MSLKPLPSDEERVLPETRGRVTAEHLAELDAARRSLQTTQQELQSVQRALDQAQHELRTTQRAFDQAQRELKTSQHDLEAARRDSLSSRERVGRGETEITTLRSAFNCLRGKYCELAAQREQAFEDLRVAKAELHRTTTELERLERLQRSLFFRLRYLPRSVGRALRHLPRDAGRLVRRAFGNGSTSRRHGPVL